MHEIKARAKERARFANGASVTPKGFACACFLCRQQGNYVHVLRRFRDLCTRATAHAAEGAAQTSVHVVGRFKHSCFDTPFHGQRILSFLDAREIGWE